MILSLPPLWQKWGGNSPLAPPSPPPMIGGGGGGGGGGGYLTPWQPWLYILGKAEYDHLLLTPTVYRKGYTYWSIDWSIEWGEGGGGDNF